MVHFSMRVLEDSTQVPMHSKALYHRAYVFSMGAQQEYRFAFANFSRIKALISVISANVCVIPATLWPTTAFQCGFLSILYPDAWVSSIANFLNTQSPEVLTASLNSLAGFMTVNKTTPYIYFIVFHSVEPQIIIFPNAKFHLFFFRFLLSLSL